MNHVFRYNKFEPSDNKFISHYDTPYYAKVTKHYSKYTLILYLTSGTASPILKVGDNFNIQEIRLMENEIWDDYWFSSDIPLIDCVICAVLDYFNAKIDLEYANKMTVTECL